MAEDVVMYDQAAVGVAKGRPGGYAAVFPADYDVNKLIDMEKTIKELIKDSQGKGKALGYISEDGVEFGVDLSNDDKNDWGADTIASSISKYAETAKTAFLESKESVLKTVYGDDNIIVNGKTTTIRHNANFTDPHIFVFDAVISSTIVKRSVLPIGRIFERDSVKQNSSDLLGYTPTIKCMPFDKWDGDTYREYLYNTAKTATPVVPGH